MSALYCYRWNHLSGKSCEIIFCPPGFASPADISTALSLAAQAVLYPDAVILVCLAEDKNVIMEAISSDRVKRSIARFADKSSVHLLVVDVTGTPIDIVAIQAIDATNLILSLSSVTVSYEAIISAGVAKVFSQKGVMVSAPQGFEFIKPSGERSSHFLRAEEGLSNSAAVDFIAFALLSRIKIENLKVIFVDSMTIASIAYSIREIRSRDGRSMPQIVSFHSHEGLRDISVPPHSTFFCIISASSSLSLEKKWLEHTRCAQTDVVTLLTFKDAVVDKRRPMCAIVRPESWRNAGLPTAGTRGLRIFGERFQPEQIPAKKVALHMIVHRCEKAAELAGRFHDRSLFSVDGRDDAGKRRTLCADGNVMLSDRDFCEWLNKQLRARVPASIQGIIYQDDTASLAMAQTCQTYLAGLGISLAWGMHSSTGFERELGALNQHRALLVVSAVIGKGTTLLGVSRDLRAKHFGAKTYLCGLQVCDSDAEASFLKRNLSQTKDRTSFFEAFHVMSMGAALAQSLEIEREILRLRDSRYDVLHYRWESMRAAGLVEDVFLPSLVPNRHRLVLRPDFVFWNPGYAESECHAPMVLAAIGRILERARTQAFDDDKHRLSSDAFQQVVLDPQNFSRYNDGIIQAALLRQAYPSELDYSSLPEESSFMLFFLKKIFAARRTQQGEAAAEFAFALGVGRLKLHPRDLSELVLEFERMTTAESGDRELLALLCPDVTIARLSAAVI